MSNIEKNYDLAIFQMTVYLLLTPPGFFVLFQVLRQKRFRHSMGWVWHITFLSLLLGASGLTISAGTHSINTTGLILSAIGICPLILLIDSLLNEAVYNTSVASNPVFSIIATILLHCVAVTGGLMLAIGASKIFSFTADPATLQNGSHLVKAGILVLVGVWAWLLVTTAIALTAWRQSSITHKLLIAIVISMPLLLVRILFGVFEFFLTSSKIFNPLNGSVVARLLMSVLPMMGVAIATLLAGVATHLRIQKSEDEPSIIPLAESNNEFPDEIVL